MTLTQEQRDKLRLEITNDPTLNNISQDSDSAYYINQKLEQPASPPFYVWKNKLSATEIKQAVLWTEVLTRSAAQIAAFQFMISDGIAPADINIRQGIADIFAGAGGITTRTNLLALAKKQATRLEKIFASGVGTEVSPATVTISNLSFKDIQRVRK